MKKISILSALLLLSYVIVAQTGPAGVGNGTNNVLWLKADAGVSTTSEGTTVSYWNDQSGNNINVSQSTNAQKPIFRSNVMNGNPAIEFDNTNTSGQNDMLTAPDNVLLDNTAGYTFFTVTRMKNLDGSTARSIVSKRTAIDTDEAFMLFYYSSNYFHLDIDGLGNRFDTGNPAFSNSTNYIIDAVYDGSLAAASRSSVFEGETLRKISAESSALVPDKTSPLVIGATHTSDNRAFGGYISEIIIYRTALNPASRIIVNNYLSAKYNIALSANDKYAGDTPANGNFDLQVAGIGKESTGHTNAFSSSISGGIGLSGITGLDNTDYLLAGHGSPTNAEITTDIAGMSGTDNARWQRIWYLDITNTSATISGTLTFNSTDAGLGIPVGDPSDYVLLYRSGLTGSWTELSNATSVSGDQITFNGQGLNNDGYYTLGLKNYIPIALPVVFTSFKGSLNNDKVILNWTTSSEINNDYFSVEKSQDAVTFEKISKVKGAGNTSNTTNYTSIDVSPSSGVNYYRIVQTDFNGKENRSNTISVENLNHSLSVFPNPIDKEETFYMDIPDSDSEEVLVVVRDIHGQEFFSKIILTYEDHHFIAINPSPSLISGIYLIVATSNQQTYSKKLIVR